MICNLLWFQPSCMHPSFLVPVIELIVVLIFSTIYLSKLRYYLFKRALFLLFAEDVCKLNYAVGPCRSAMRRWYYDFNEGTCKTFLYGGCLGNKNNYETQQECESVCTRERKYTCFTVNAKYSPSLFLPHTNKSCFVRF